MSESHGQYFAARPTARSKPKTVTLNLPDLSIELATDRATFSPDRVDAGTRYLLQAAPLPPEGATELLDLGAGYGPIAVTLARRAPSATVWATEVNERAAELCAANAQRAGVAEQVRVVQAPEGERPLTQVPTDIMFDAIYTNPPIRIGKPKLHALLLDALHRLRPDGHAYLVVHKHLGSDSLQRWLTDQGWPTDRLGSRAGYRILATRPAAGPPRPARPKPA